MNNPPILPRLDPAVIHSLEQHKEQLLNLEYSPTASSIVDCIDALLAELRRG